MAETCRGRLLPTVVWFWYEPMKIVGNPMGSPSLAGTEAPCEFSTVIDKPLMPTVWPPNLCHQLVIVWYVLVDPVTVISPSWYCLVNDRELVEVSVQSTVAVVPPVAEAPPEPATPPVPAAPPVAPLPAVPPELAVPPLPAIPPAPVLPPRPRPRPPRCAPRRPPPRRGGPPPPRPPPPARRPPPRPRRGPPPRPPPPV